MTKHLSMNLFPDKTEYMHVHDDVIAGGIAAPLTKFVSKLGGIVALQPSGARNVIIVYGRSASVFLSTQSCPYTMITFRASACFRSVSRRAKIYIQTYKKAKSHKETTEDPMASKSVHVQKVAMWP